MEVIEEYHCKNMNYVQSSIEQWLSKFDIC